MKKLLAILLAYTVGLSISDMYASSSSHKKISLNFENEDVNTIINYLASKMRVNIIIHTNAIPLAFKVTLHNQKKVPLEDAFNFLYTILDVAGYYMNPYGDDYIIKKKDENAKTGSVKDPLQVYIGIPPEELPHTDERIRYVYYFDHFKVDPSGNLKRYTDEIKTILTDLGLSDVSFDAGSNSMLIIGKAHLIKTGMTVITELDKIGFREVVEIIKLSHTDATFVSNFINSNLLTKQNDSKATFTFAQTIESPEYFVKGTKVVPLTRTNSLIILGKEKAVDRLKDFIYKYVDIPLESGDSLIHVYDLQYLDAQKLQTTLKSMIAAQKADDQSKGTTPLEEQFKNVIIEVETFEEEQGKTLQTQSSIGEVGKVLRGGNRLLIASNKRDWVHIKELIASLDKPQSQVAIEVLIADVTLDHDKILASQTRNKQDTPIKNANFQAAHMSAPVLDNATNPTTVAANLLTLFTSGSTTGNIASFATPGSFILSFQDTIGSGIWWVLQTLKEYTNSKILSHPHNIVLNHQQARITLSETRLIRDRAVTQPDGTINIQNTNFPAKLEVDVLPRISTNNKINLDIAIHVEDFIDRTATDNSKTIRTVRTNATVGNGEVLVLGGLVRTHESDTSRETPLLAKIPIIGWLFKGKVQTTKKDNLMIFVSPTIIRPRAEGGMSDATERKFAYGKNLVSNDENDLFGQLKDPINHWFFRIPEHGGSDLMKQYQNLDTSIDQPKQVYPQEVPEKSIIPKQQSGSSLKRRAGILKKNQKNPAFTL